MVPLMVENQSFECAPGLQLRAHERLTEVHFKNVERRLERIEQAMERLEKRLWIAVYGIVAVVLTQGIRSIMDIAPGVMH